VNATAVSAAVSAATEKARKLPRKTMRAISACPQVRERLRRDLAARGLSAGDIASILGGVLPDSAAFALVSSTPPRN